MLTDNQTSVLHIQLRLPNTTYLNHAISTSTRSTMEFGTLLSKTRQQKKRSQGEIAQRVGVSQSTYHAWESGHSQPKVKYYASLADALGIDLKDLIPESLSITIQPLNGSPEDSTTTNARTLYEELTSSQKQLIVLQQQRIEQLEAEVQQLRALTGLL